MSNNLKRAIKYNRVKGYWYLEGSNHSEYRQLQNGERLTTIGTVQYFSNGTKKIFAKLDCRNNGSCSQFFSGTRRKK